jgi:hypothetical protein
VLQTIAAEQGIDLKKYRTWIPLLMGTLGGMFLMGNTASIDTGFQKLELHMFCARYFFLLTILAQLYNTAVYASLSKLISAIRKENLYLKYLIVALLVLQIAQSLVDGSEREGGENSDKGKFLEWTGTVTVVSMFLSIALDASKFEFVYTDISVPTPTCSLDS